MSHSDSIVIFTQGKRASMDFKKIQIHVKSQVKAMVAHFQREIKRIHIYLESMHFKERVQVEGTHKSLE